MQTFLAILLLVNALFSLVVWPRFFGRIAKDPRARDSAGRPTRFLIVHVVLIAVAVVLGVVSAVAGIWGLVA